MNLAFQPPGRALRPVFGLNTLGGQLVTNGVSAGEVFSFASSGAFGEQAINLGLVILAEAFQPEPGIRITLQKPEQLTSLVEL